jgi:hypothetical protein
MLTSRGVSTDKTQRGKTFVFFLTIAHERMKRCFLYACYGNPFTLSLRLPYELFSAPSPEPPLIARGGCPWSMPSLRAIT